MTKQRSKQTVQKIKANVQEGHYSLKKVSEGERNLSRGKRIKKL